MFFGIARAKAHGQGSLFEAAGSGFNQGKIRPEPGGSFAIGRFVVQLHGVRSHHLTAAVCFTKLFMESEIIHMVACN